MSSLRRGIGRRVRRQVTTHRNVGGAFSRFVGTSNNGRFIFYGSRRRIRSFLSRGLKCGRGRKVRLPGVSTARKLILVISPRANVRIRVRLYRYVSSPSGAFCSTRTTGGRTTVFVLGPGIVPCSLDYTLRSTSALPSTYLGDTLNRRRKQRAVGEGTHFFASCFFRGYERGSY